MVEIFSIGAVIAGISNIVFGLLVYLNNRNNLFGKIFFLLSISFTLWILPYSIWISQPDAESALFWSRVLNLGATWIPILFLHWILVFLNETKKYKVLLILAYVGTVFFSIFSFSKYYISSVEQVGIYQYWPQAGILYTIFLSFFFIGLFAFALQKLFFDGYLKGDKNTKTQAKYYLLGSIISVIAGSSNFPLMYGFEFPAILTLLTIFHPMLWAYGTLKYQIFKSKVIITELIVFLLWVLLIGRIFIDKNIGEQLVDITLFILSIFMGIILIRNVEKEIKTREEIQKLANNLKIANVRLKKLDKQKSEFVSIASHQLRAPIASLKGYSSMILEGSYGPVSKKVSNAVQRLFQSSQSLSLIIDDFLNLSRIERGKIEYDFTINDLRNIVEEAINTSLPLANEREIKLTRKITTVECKCNIDADKIRQMCINLINNAIKYTSKGSVDIKLSKIENKLLFEVSDTGIGIPETEMSNLFKKFSRLSNANETNIKGTGLGLYLAKQIVEAHQGKIWAESKGKGKGTTFCVELKGVIK